MMKEFIEFMITFWITVLGVGLGLFLAIPQIAMYFSPALENITYPHACLMATIIIAVADLMKMRMGE